MQRHLRQEGWADRRKVAEKRAETERSRVDARREAGHRREVTASRGQIDEQTQVLAARPWDRHGLVSFPARDDCRAKTGSRQTREKHGRGLAFSLTGQPATIRRRNPARRDKST